MTIVNLLLGFIYFMLLIYSFTRIKIFKLSTKKTLSGKLMYTFIIILCISMLGMNLYDTIRSFTT